MEKYNKYIPWILILVTWTSVSQFMSFEIGGSWWCYRIIELSLLFYFYKIGKGNAEKSRMPLNIKLFIVCILCSWIYGFFMFEDYSDFQHLTSNTLTWLMVLAYFFVLKPDNISYLTQKWCKMLLLFCLLLPFMQGEGVGRIFAPFTFILMFWPFLGKKWKITSCIVIVATLFIGTLDARTSVLRFILSLCIGLCMYVVQYVPKKILNYISITLLILPIIFVYLGITGQFNIFSYQEETGGDKYVSQSSFGTGEEVSLSEDTRTALFEEEILSAINNNYIIWGRSMARGYDSPRMGWKYDSVPGRWERYKCEVRALNCFNHMGLVGLVLLSLIYVIAVYNSFTKSKSKYLQLIGVCVAGRYVFMWFEDIDNFDLINVYLWFTIMMCYSPAFLNMNDRDFKEWARKIL